MGMKRTMDSEEFQVEFPSEWESFAEFFLSENEAWGLQAEDCKFKLEIFAGEDEERDELSGVTAWLDGEEIASYDGTEWA